MRKKPLIARIFVVLIAVILLAAVIYSSLYTIIS